MNRRHWLKAMTALLALGAMAPLRLLAAVWNKPAFESQHLDGALQGLGASHIATSKDIVLVAPDMAENGAIVQIEVESRIPATEAISVLVEKNPTPLIANFVFSPDTVPAFVTRIKMAETSELKIIVKAGGKYFSTSKTVEVALGGCG